ncbi:phage portal protein [Anaerococcus sp. Marseille-P3625]|uniref:phage portal protein n=1 Tax=Anaerococcus sp. Marseille-P3625 TaxID=1977277 RepID=UPI000C088E7B|nr:phage portal protein [Anaerococcus sp. Marseille-P3625]
MTEDKRIKVNFASKGGSFNADQFVPRLKYSYYDNESPMEDMFVSTNYREKENKLSFELLEKISLEVAPISNIISTRIDQVGTFTSRSKYATDGVGFKVMLKDSSKEPTEEQEKTIDLIEKFIENCGLGNDPNRDRFDTFIRKIIRDSLTYDQVNFELEYDVTGQFVQAFEAVDAATIKPALDNIDLKESAYADDIDIRDGEKLSYVQVVDGKIVAGFTADEMAFAVRNPRTSVHSQPYGLSEIETIVRQLTSYLEAEDYNMRFFQQGGMTKGILNIKGEKNGPAPGDRQTLESFKRQWRTQVTGQKGAWKIPVFTLPGELEFINIAQSGGEMVFEKWVNYLINIICGAYKIDPAEINFPNNGGVGGKGSSLFSGDEKKIDNSKAKGLFPLLRFVENTINKFIVSKFNTEDEYVFIFDGIDKESESDQVDLAKKKSESYMTINEVRAEKGLAEIEGGDIIANPYYLQAKQMLPSDNSMGFDFEDSGEEDDTEESEETQESLFQKSLALVNKELELENILEKKLDRSKLVLMETQVEDKYGVHRAKRWKNPNIALNEIKKQMKVAQNSNLSFKSKAKHGIILSEKELIDQYLKQNPNETLQEFIKHNFIIEKQETLKPKKIKEDPKVEVKEVEPKEFVKALSEAIESMPKYKRWRVSSKTEEECQDLKCYRTDGGSVFAITNQGDIEAVCKNSNDNIRGRDLLKEAVRLGGKKLDSFIGNHKFYSEIGFTAYSRCKFDKNYKPPLWREGYDKEEDIAFYVYDGNTEFEKWSKQKSKIKEFNGETAYEDAYNYRDNILKE